MACPKGMTRCGRTRSRCPSRARVTLPGRALFSPAEGSTPYPQLVSNVMMQPDGNTHYDSLQTKMERRFEAGRAVSAGYTWSKAMALNFNGTVDT